jgi:hypothetical protein
MNNQIHEYDDEEVDPYNDISSPKIWERAMEHGMWKSGLKLQIFYTINNWHSNFSNKVEQNTFEKHLSVLLNGTDKVYLQILSEYWHSGPKTHGIYNTYILTKTIS